MSAPEQVQWATLAAASLSAVAASGTAVTSYKRFLREAPLPALEVTRYKQDFVALTVRNRASSARVVYTLGAMRDTIFAGGRWEFRADLPDPDYPVAVEGPALPHRLEPGERAMWLLSASDVGEFLHVLTNRTRRGIHLYVELGDRVYKRRLTRSFRTELLRDS